MASKARDLSNFISVATIDASEIASNAITADKIADVAVTHAKLHTDMNLSGKTLTFATNQISGNAIDGGVISNFASTGIDDNSSATAVTINSSGNVGIGTASPTAMIDLSKSGTGDYSTIRFSNTGASGKRYEIGLGGNTSSAGYSNNLYFYDSTASALRMVLDSSGNVGIGTNSPWAKMQVQITDTGGPGSGSAAGMWLRNGSGTAGQAFNMYWGNSQSAAAGSIALVVDDNTNNYGSIQFQTRTSSGGYGTKLAIASNGNVGIGTTTPDAKLEVNGTFKQGQYVRIPLSLNWSNAIANATAKISLGTSAFWGTIKVTVTAQYSNANASGVYSKIYSCGLNSNSPYTNSSQIAENGGETSKHFQLENYMSWDSTNSEWYLGIHHLEASGNRSDILLEAWCASDTFANNLLTAYTSSVTTDSNIAFKRPEYSSYTISQVHAVGSENNYVHDGLQLLFDAHHGFINGQAPYCLITGTTATMAGTASTTKQNIGGVNCLEISDDGSVQWPGKVQGTPRTYEIWVYHKDANPDGRNWESYFDDASSESVLFGKQGSTNLLSVYTAGSAADVVRGQKWFQAAYTIDDTSQNYSVRLFFNGELVDQDYNSLARTLSAAGSTLYMGGDAGGECLNGYIALARVYNRALSNEELRQNFDNNRERFGI